MVVLFFFIIAAMRVVQKVCGKVVSKKLNSGMLYLHYGAYYQFMSALFALILLCFVGFYGANDATVLCALASAACFALELYASNEALKCCTISICNVVSMGGLFLPCIVGIFLFDEPMGVWQWVGLGIFVLSVAFLASSSKKTYNAFTWRTALMLFLSFSLNGLVMIIQKYFALLVPDGNVALFSMLTFAFGGAIFLIGMLSLAVFRRRDKEGNRINEIKVLPKPLLICGVLLAVALFTINQLVTTMAKTVPSAVLFPISSAISILLGFVIGAVMFKEKPTVTNIIGILLGIGAIVIINVL